MMNIKSSIIVFVLASILLSAPVNVIAVELDINFMKSKTGNSSINITVEQLVEYIENLKLNNGRNPKIIGWKRNSNNYTFTFIANKKIVLKFTHLANQGGGWSSISATEDGKPIDALALIMQISFMPRDKTKTELANEARALKEKERIVNEAYENLPGEYRMYKYRGQKGIDHQLFVELKGGKVKMESNYDCAILEKEVPITKSKDLFVAEYNEQACKISATFIINYDNPSYGSIILRDKGDCTSVCNQMPPTQNCCPVNKVDNSYIAKAEQAKEKGDYVSALEIYGNERNAPEASYLLGLMYLKGDGVKQDYDKAASYFYEASDRGSSDATVKLINLATSNKLSDSNLRYGDWRSDIDRLFEVGANQGHSQLQYLYAIKLYNEAKLETNLEKKESIENTAYRYLEKSAKKGYEDAIKLLSKIKKS